MNEERVRQELKAAGRTHCRRRQPPPGIILGRLTYRLISEPE
jgi:hypothetical protein